ncbi:MAG TPA: ABC transporter permease [Microlunatus sp.]
MMHVLGAEIRRLLARRVTLIGLLGLLALMALFQLQVSSMVSPPSAETVAASQRSYDEYLREWEANHEEWEADCVDGGGSPQECAQPRPEPSDWGLAPTAYDVAASVAVSFGVYLGGMTVFVVAASFIAAEISTGSLANWLTFVPQRGRVFVSKLAVAAGFSLLVGLLLGVFTVGASALITVLQGQPLSGIDAIVAMAARGVLPVLAFGVLGFCTGLLTGSTGASVGVLLGGVFGVFVRSILAFSSVWAQRLSPWSPELNLEAILQNGTTYAVASGPTVDDSGVERALGLGQALGYWGVLLAALVAVSWLVFRRRDVT